MEHVNGATCVWEKSMKPNPKAFARDESGAVTTDWVVLVAAVLTLGVAVFVAVDTGTMELAQGTADYLTDARN